QSFAASQFQQSVDGGPTFPECLFELMAAVVPRLSDIAQRDGLAGEFRTDRAAEKFASVEQADLRDGARVGAEDNRLPDVSGKQWIDVAHALKADTVGSHDTGPGHREQQEIELFEGFWHARQKSVSPPPFPRLKFRFAVRTQVIFAQELAEALIEIGQRE